MEEETRQAFVGMFSKPQLTDKLLSKPPFKFIHDVVKNCGFLANSGVFSAEQMDAGQMADKEAKLAFLKMLIEAVQNANGEKIDARPAKILGGLEADKTNTLLQVKHA